MNVNGKKNVEILCPDLIMDPTISQQIASK